MPINLTVQSKTLYQLNTDQYRENDSVWQPKMNEISFDIRPVAICQFVKWQFIRTIRFAIDTV